jgi:hypothetical protein
MFSIPLGIFYGTIFSSYVFFSPLCQIINRGIMENVHNEEEIYRVLVEKCDIYDNIDAILSLRDKYSLFEMEQLNKEKKMKKNKIIVENMERFAELRRGAKI